MHPDAAHHFLVLSYVALAAIVAIFAMRAFASARQSRRKADDDGALASDLAEIKARLGAVETLLREVG